MDGWMDFYLKCSASLNLVNDGQIFSLKLSHSRHEILTCLTMGEKYIRKITNLENTGNVGQE